MTESDHQGLAERLAARRKALGITQTEAAARTGVTLRTWQRWENGESRGHVGYIPAMAAALETTPQELLGAGDGAADAPRGLEDLAMERRLAGIEAQQGLILELLGRLAGQDPVEVLQQADELLREEPHERSRKRRSGG